MEKDGYILNIDDPAIRSEEVDRLRIQGRVVTGAVPLLPYGFDVSQPCAILDVACGAGEWAVEVKKRYPHMRVIAGDINPICLRYAQEQARVAGLRDGIEFFSMDIFHPFPFPDNVFDLVNARFVGGVVSRGQWDELLKEIYRVIKPGGSVRLVEGDAFTHTSGALLQIFQYIAQSVYRAGKGFNPNGYVITPMFAPLLRRSGFADIQYSATVLNYSIGTDLHDVIIQDFKAVVDLILKSGVDLRMPREQIEEMYRQMCLEIDGEDFYALWPLICVVGRKPV
jgi:ubiquinone/menaquinone biosynthesis C-methylase UbiE